VQLAVSQNVGAGMRPRLSRHVLYGRRYDQVSGWGGVDDQLKLWPPPHRLYWYSLLL